MLRSATTLAPLPWKGFGEIPSLAFSLRTAIYGSLAIQYYGYLLLYKKAVETHEVSGRQQIVLQVSTVDLHTVVCQQCKNHDKQSKDDFLYSYGKRHALILDSEKTRVLFTSVFLPIHLTERLHGVFSNL